MITRVVRQAVLLLAAGAFALNPPRTAAKSSPQGHEKQIFVTVLDKSGAVVKDLSAKDFSVKEDNATRQVTGAELATEPLFLSVLVDTTSPPPGLESAPQDLRKALTSFVSALQSTREDTAISLTEIAGAAVTTVNFTTKTDQLRAAIQKIYPGQRSGAVLLEALVDASKRIDSATPSPRRAILEIDFDSAESSQVLPTKVFEAVQAAGASVWALSIVRTGDSIKSENNYTANAPVKEAVLSKLPDVTGGQRIRSIGTSSLESTLLRVADILTHQYMVTYVRPDGNPVSSIKPSSPRGVKVLMSPWVR
jgi:hypothetical protein